MAINTSPAGGPRASSPVALRAWIIWGLGALAFGYAFFQRVAPSVMVSDLMREFAVGAAALGNLSGFYFYPYVAMQVPVGILTDRLGPRVMLTASVTLAAAGTLIFASATTIAEANVGRMLIGTGSAAGFISALSLASRWFPPERFASLVGMTMLVGMAGGFSGQAPLALAIESAGDWRAVMVVAAIFAGLLALASFAVVRDSPDGARLRPKEEHPWKGLWRDLKLTFTIRHVWLAALVGSAMSGPLLAFGGLWGVPYLVERFDMSRAEAAFFTSLTLVGWALGAPLGGWISDRLRRRRLPLITTAYITLGSFCLMVYVPGLPLAVIIILFFAIGLFGGSMVSAYALARELTPTRIHGTVTGVVNGSTVGAGAVLQPVIGLMLDLNWTGEIVDGARVYSLAAYETAFLPLVAWAAAGALASLFLRETYAQPLSEASKNGR